MNEHEFEPIRGLPANLPPGESILWQGEPLWRDLALRAFHVRKIAVYFALLIAWRLGSAHAEGLPLLAAAQSAVPLALLGLSAVGVLAALAVAACRTTVYTITNRRVVLRIGIALPITINVPFAVIESAAVRLYRNGTGDIPLSLLGSGRVAYIPLWPHARPWRVARPEPMLRTIPDAARVAGILSQALASFGARPERGADVPGRAARPAAHRAEARVQPDAEIWPEAVA